MRHKGKCLGSSPSQGGESSVENVRSVDERGSTWLLRSAKPACPRSTACRHRDEKQIPSLPKAATMWACDGRLTTVSSHSCLWETDWEMGSDPPSPVFSLSLEDAWDLSWLLPTDQQTHGFHEYTTSEPSFCLLRKSSSSLALIKHAAMLQATPLKTLQ